MYKSIPNKYITFVFLSVYFLSRSPISHAENKLPIEWGVTAKHGTVLQNRSFKSKTTGVTYPYHAYLPKGYAQNAKHYPVIYITDAQWVFNSFVKDVDQEALEVILIAIEEGPRRSKRRRIDYTFPGVTHYFSFFSNEFIPSIEKQFRINGDQRSIQGASLGGQFVITAMLIDNIEKNIFKNYLAFDVSIRHQYKTLIKLLKTRKKRSQKLEATLYITGAAKGGAKQNKGFYQTLKKINFDHLKLIYKKHDVDHYAISSASFKPIVEQLKFKSAK